MECHHPKRTKATFSHHSNKLELSLSSRHLLVALDRKDSIRERMEDFLLLLRLAKALLRSSSVVDAGNRKQMLVSCCRLLVCVVWCMFVVMVGEVEDSFEISFRTVKLCNLSFCTPL